MKVMANLVRDLLTLVLLHIKRDANNVADLIDNMGTQLRVRTLIDSPIDLEREPFLSNCFYFLNKNGYIK